jgi:hypothetical protein
MRFLKHLLVIAMMITVIVILACGDDDPVGGGGGGGGGGSCGTPADISGTWKVVENETQNSCGPTESNMFDVAITQNEDTVRVTTPDGTFTGIVCGRTTTSSGSFPKDQGTATFTMTETIAQNGQTSTGSTTWSWTDGTNNCNGASSSFSVKQLGLVPCGFPVDVAGTWTISTQDVINSCGAPESDQYDVVISQNGSTLTVTTPTGTFVGGVCGNFISWTGSFPEQGGTTTIETMSLLVSEDGQSLSGGSLWSWSSPSGSCRGGNTITGTRGGSGPGNFTGDWEITETIVGCGTTDTQTYEYNIAQTGNSAIIGYIWNGTVNGNQITWTESASWLDTTITGVYDLTAAPDWNSMSGTSDWVFKVGGITQCTGDGTVLATRVGGIRAATTSDPWVILRNRFLTMVHKVPQR